MTITAAQERRQLRIRLSRFVFSVEANYMNESLPRWDEPVCPLVAGLPRDQGEYILARITQVAAAAHAPLAGRHCKANLFVIATSTPDLFLRKWWDRDREMYNDCNGLGEVGEFLHSKQPIRSWYNIVPAGPNGGRAVPVVADAPGLGLNMNLGTRAGCVSGGFAGTLIALAPQGLAQAFVVVDMRQIRHLTIGQLADYVSMVGLTQIRPDIHPTGPSILTLFEKQKHPPQRLSAWDRALLYALYHTPQSNPLEVSLMETSMVSRILRSR